MDSEITLPSLRAVEGFDSLGDYLIVFDDGGRPTWALVSCCKKTGKRVTVWAESGIEVDEAVTKIIRRFKLPKARAGEWP